MLNIELECVASEQGPGLGGAMLAMVACGAYPTVQAACQALVQVSEVIRPEPELARRYDGRYNQFRQIYPACRQLFQQLQQ